MKASDTFDDFEEENEVGKLDKEKKRHLVQKPKKLLE